MPRIKAGIAEEWIGARIRRLRVMRRMTQPALGKVIGVTWQQVQKFEKGTNRISASQLFRIADEFGVPIEHFAPKPLGKTANGGVPDESVERALRFAQTAEGLALLHAFMRVEKDIGRALIAFAQRVARTQTMAKPPKRRS